MTENPNIKAEILLWCLERHTADNTTFDIPQFAEEKGYDQRRVCRKVGEMYPLLEYGISPKYPWIGYGQMPAIREQLEDWGYLD